MAFSSRNRAWRLRSEFRLETLEDRVLLAGVELGTAANFAVLAGSTVTNTGPTVLEGSLGLSPGTAITGFPPGVVTGGTTHTADAVATEAQIDLTTAYTFAAGLAPTMDLTDQDLGGLTLTPGVYQFSTSAQLTGTLILDFLGDPNAEFVFQIGSTLTTASNSSVVHINTGDLLAGCNVYYQVGSSATLGTDTAFQGNILALTSITMDTGATILHGRALARNGAVTLDSNRISNVCADSISPPPTDPTEPPPTDPTQPPPTDPTQPPPTDPTQPPTTTDPTQPPVVINLQRFGFHAQPTLLVLTFSEPLDLEQARNISNYDLRYAGPGRLSGTRIAVDSATYDPISNTVTLALQQLLPLRRTYRLAVENLGTNFEKTFGDEILSGPSSPRNMNFRTRSATTRVFAWQSRPLMNNNFGAQRTALTSTGREVSFSTWNAATRQRFFRHYLRGR